MRTSRTVLSVAIVAAAALLLPACADETKGDDDDDDDPIPTDVDYLTEERLAASASYLASDELQGRESGTPGNALARTYIIEQLQACGVQPGVVNSFEQPITTGIGTNVIGVVPGTDPSLRERYVLISAHYDHLGVIGSDVFNGAADNAAAVASLIGVACELAESPPERSIIVAAFDSEEPPFFMTDSMGSEFYAANPTVPLELIDVTLVVDFAGTGMWPGTPLHLVLGMELSPELAPHMAAAAAPEGLMPRRAGIHLIEQMITGYQRWADYAAFHDRGRPALFITDGFYKQYHRPEDTFDLLNIPKLRAEAVYELDLVRRFAADPVLPTYDGSRADYAVDAASIIELLDLSLTPGGMVDALGLTPASRSLLEGDKVDVLAVKATLDGGGTLTSTEVGTLRSAAQRVMCLTGSAYEESLCSYL